MEASLPPSADQDPAGTLYCRSTDVEEQTFEDELLLLHRANRTVLGLNQAAAGLWEALRWPQSVDDLVQILAEAWPAQGIDWVRGEVSAALEPLLEHAFVLRVDP